MKRIKALMYGVGVVARTVMVRLMIEKGVDVVGAISGGKTYRLYRYMQD